MAKREEVLRILQSGKEYEEELLQKMEEVICQARNELRALYPSKSAYARGNYNEEQKRQVVIKKIEEFILEMIIPFSKKKAPKILLRNIYSWDNIIFDETVQLKPVDESTMVEVRFNDQRSFPKFGLITCLLTKIFKLLSTHETYTKRELFYQNYETITTQDRSNSALNEISCLLESPLHELNIFSTSKGTIYGPVKLKMSSSNIDCRKAGGTLIPNDISNVVEIYSTAKYILLIEKDAIFDKFIQEEMTGLLSSCIFITGKGFPDINTRALLKRMWDTLSIPIFALVDANPWGIEIMCVYRFGSLAMSHQADGLAVSSVRWLGVLPSEIGNMFHRSEPLNKSDKRKVKNLLQRPYIKNNRKLRREINILAERNWKAEIEFEEIRQNYLTQIYIPNKILCAGYI